MITQAIKGRRLYTKYCWFEQDLNEIEEKGCDRINVFCFKGAPEEAERFGYSSFPQSTLLSRLETNEGDMLGAFSKTVRNEIRRCEKEENVEVCFATELEEICALLEGFDEMYRAMYLEKGLGEHFLPKKELKEYARTRNCMLSVGKIEGKPVVYHSYVYSGCDCRLLHSCSEFRIADRALRNAIGRLNKYLHWEDIRWFCGANVTWYDWGGISSKESPNGIDRFKMSFGGAEVDYLNLSKNVSLRAKLLKLVKSLAAYG